MVGWRQRGYCGIAQHLAASTGIGAGYKIHSYSAILRDDSSLIVTIQMCTIYGMGQYNVIVPFLRNETERPFPLYETPV